jgi:hypothetical protein
MAIHWLGKKMHFVLKLTQKHFFLKRVAPLAMRKEFVRSAQCELSVWNMH